MRIGGLQKTTLLDFPGKVSALVFAQGCNFHCPYCHNPELLAQRDGSLPAPEVLDFLAKRRRLLEGVVITGGEPTLQEGLYGFCSELKSLGYAIKLDTNGSRPDVLRRIMDLGLVDYVAMDVKADPSRYPTEIAPEDSSAAVMESIALLAESAVAHEFRVPCAAPFVDEKSFEAILNATWGAAPIFLQMIRRNRILSPDFFTEKGRIMTREEVENFIARAKEMRERDRAGQPVSIVTRFL